MIRLNGINIDDKFYISFLNCSKINFSKNEIYISMLINNEKLIDYKELNFSYIMETKNNSIRKVLKAEDDGIIYKDNDSLTKVNFNELIFLPLWEEAREWLKNKGFYLNFHYDPIFNEENIKIGFIKPKNMIIEAEGKTDRECIYKIMFEVIKKEKEFDF